MVISLPAKVHVTGECLTAFPERPPPRSPPAWTVPYGRAKSVPVPAAAFVAEQERASRHACGPPANGVRAIEAPSVPVPALVSFRLPAVLPHTHIAAVCIYARPV
jgi:hypothetical protein